MPNATIIITCVSQTFAMTEKTLARGVPKTQTARVQIKFAWQTQVFAKISSQVLARLVKEMATAKKVRG